MNWRLFVPVLCVTAVPAFSASALDVKAPPGWTEAERSNDMVLFYKDNEKVHARELLAFTEFDAPPATVFRLTTDYENWAKLVPYTKESKILAKLTATELITYQRISPPFVSDRDYYLHVKLTPASPATNGVYKTEWTAVPDYQAEKEGVVRMRINSGWWRYEPIDGGTRTRVVYSSVQHAGGAIPAWLANRSSLRFIPSLFKALRDHLNAKNPPRSEH